MEAIKLSDEQLIVQIRISSTTQESSRLLNILVQRYEEALIRKCYYYVKNWETAQDLSQEIWIRVLNKLDQFHTEDYFVLWLFRIAHNRCYDHIYQVKQKFTQEISQKIINALEEVDESTLNELTIEIFEELIEEVGDKCKSILLLKYQKNWSIDDIAQDLSISKSSVKMRLARCKERMQDLLKNYHYKAN